MTNLKYNQDPGDYKDDIYIDELINTIKRNKKFILTFSSIFFIISVIYSVVKKPMWEGNFQIVMVNKDQNRPSAEFLSKNPALSDLIGIDTKSELLTEVKILESRSILTPIYNFVKNYKEQKNIDTTKMRFKDWKEDNLSIVIEDGTSVLDLSYKDKNKDLVIPVLNMISKDYQAYSRKNRLTGLKDGLNYLDNQIEIYKNKSVEKLRKAQQYAIDYDLTALDTDSEIDKEILNSLNIERIRVNAANNIKNLEQQINDLDSIRNNPEALMFLGRSVPILVQQGLPAKLDQIDTRITELKENYTDKDRVIKRLKEKRKLTINLLTRQTYGYLNAQLYNQKAILKSAERPKGVLIKYNQLMKDSLLVDKTLESLEKERQIIGLENARSLRPWDLISEPTIDDKPVSPNKLRIILLGFLAGPFISILWSLLFEKNKSLVFSERSFKKIINYPLLMRFNSNNDDSWKIQMNLIIKSLSAKSEIKSLSLISIGKVAEDKINTLIMLIKELLPNKKVHNEKDLSITKGYSHQILVVSSDGAPKDVLNYFNQDLIVNNAYIDGWIFIK